MSFMTNNLVFILDKWCEILELFFQRPIDYLEGIIGLILAFFLFYTAGTVIIACLQHTYVPLIVKYMIRGIAVFCMICISPILIFFVNRKLLVKKIRRFADQVIERRDS